MTGTLVGHWPLTEDSGSTAYDYSGNENHGSITGAGPAGTGTVTGPFGNSAYDFDGSDDIIGPFASSKFAYTSNVSVSCWVKKDTTKTRNPFVARGNTRSTQGFSDWALSSGDGEIYWEGDNSTTNKKVTYEISNNVWYHAVGTYDNSTLRLYVDGALVNTEGLSGPLRSGEEVRIGAAEEGGGVIKNLNGKLSDVRIYNRTLSPQEVQALYQAGVKSEVTFK